MSIKLLIADDHEIIRSGVRALLGSTEITIVAEASDGEQTLVLLAQVQPDVVLLDIRMPSRDGLEALAIIRDRHGNLPVLMYTAYDNPAYEARCLALGASGYLLKSCARDKLLAAIRTAATGGRIWTRTDMRRLSGYTASAEPLAEGEIPLTPRETDVLRRVGQGQTNKVIAEHLSISTETVKEHVQHILRKLGVSDRTQAAVWAARHGLI